MDDRTERRYEALRRRINREYRQAEKELREKMEEFFAKSAERDKKKRQELADGKITMQEYQRWLRGQVFQGKRWQEKIDQAARQLTQVDETATAIVNGERLNVFADNMNYQNGEAERIIGARFDLYDQATVARLLDEQPNLLPPRKVKRSEDVPWYHKLINNCVTQGILQGESVPQIAKRIGEQTGERGRTAMLRNARTAVTSAQNAGRIEAMHQQEQMGIRVQKKWIAAIDNRTRDAHRDPALAEQVIDIDQPFKTKLGEILFPGDPAAHPANVYNCRCTLGYVYPEYQDTGKDEERRTEANDGAAQGEANAPTYTSAEDYDREIARLMERRQELFDSGAYDKAETDALLQQIFTLQDQKADYVNAHNLANGDTRLTNMLRSGNAEQISTAVNEILNNELPSARGSAWNGSTTEKADAEMPDAAGQANWDGSIWIRRTAVNDLKVHVHEHLHMRSVNSYGQEGKAAYHAHQKIEEGIVELLAQEICKKKGVTFTGTYTDQVDALKYVHKVLFPKMNDYDFAKRMFDLHPAARYNMLEAAKNDWERKSQRHRKKVRDDLNTAMTNLKGAFEKK